MLACAQDRFDLIVDRTEEGLENLRIQAKFVRKLAKIEEEYGTSLQKLVKETKKESFTKKTLEKCVRLGEKGDLCCADVLDR